MTCKCSDSNCVRPAPSEPRMQGYSEACFNRWRNAGFPEGGPRPPLTRTACGLRSGAARAPVPDLYDVRWTAGEPERRVNRVRRQAADLVRCVAARDGAGVALLLERVTDPEALLIVLAECASPERAAVVCGLVLAA
jgi:hypothetical protein